MEKYDVIAVFANIHEVYYYLEDRPQITNYTITVKEIGEESCIAMLSYNKPKGMTDIEFMELREGE